jgi:hypothetical protein
MDTESLTRWNFREELRTTAANCVGLKPETAKKKVSAIFNKYHSLISSSESNEKYYMRQSNELYNQFKTLKSGVISYTQGEIKGKILLKDIEQIEVREKDVLLITKTGRQITMGEDFKYLKDLF